LGSITITTITVSLFKKLNLNIECQNVSDIIFFCIFVEVSKSKYVKNGSFLLSSYNPFNFTLYCVGWEFIIFLFFNMMISNYLKKTSIYTYFVAFSFCCRSKSICYTPSKSKSNLNTPSPYYR
jgi:hypothetical protein